jgi:hypothetical protein
MISIPVLPITFLLHLGNIIKIDVSTGSKDLSSAMLLNLVNFKNILTRYAWKLYFSQLIVSRSLLKIGYQFKIVIFSVVTRRILK